MRKFTRIFLALALAFAVSSCERDDVDQTTAGGVEGYGSDLTVHLASDFSELFPLESITCEIRTAAEEEIIITAMHTLVNGESVLLLDKALPIGRNILRSVRYTGSSDTRSDYSEVAMGCSINVAQSENGIYPAIYNSLYNLYGDGTKENPYQIASALNVAAINEMDRTDCYFAQAGPIDFMPYYGHERGFEGICPDYNRPFSGVFLGAGDLGHTIKNLAVRRYTEEELDISGGDVPTTKPAGLFGCLSGAVIKNIKLDNPDVSGDEAVGGIAGVIIGVSGSVDSSTIIDNCHIIRSEENDNQIFGAMGVGGIVGVVEYLGDAAISNCSVAREVILKARSGEDGNYLGGIVGASGLDATISLSGCTNNAPITGDGIIGLGGIIGSAQTIVMTGCTNTGAVTLKSGTNETISVGGLIGGSTQATVFGSLNTGRVEGTRGVGGIIGSALYDAGAETEQFGNVSVISCHNKGEVYGTQSVGGLVGEAQVLFVNSANYASVSECSAAGASYDEPEVGGLIGFASSLMARGSHNLGDVNGHYSGGISGIAEYFFIYGCSNFGSVDGTDTGGMIGKTCEYGLLNYGVNYGAINGSGSVGGLVGTLGEHLSTADKFAEYAKDAAKDCAWTLAKWGAEEGTSKLAKWLAKKEHPIYDAAMAYSPILIELLELGREIQFGVIAGNERAEHDEELCETPEELTEFIEESVASMDSDMISDIKMKFTTGYQYSGAMDLHTNTITSTVFNNLANFAAAIETDEVSTDAESEGFMMMTVKSYEDLKDVSMTTARAAFIKEVLAVTASCAIAAASMGTTTGFKIYSRFKKADEKVEAVKKLKKAHKICLTVSTVGALTLDAAVDLSEDVDNTILINQGINFGSIGGNGLIGTIGDRIGLRNCLSAGRTTGYSVAGKANSRNLYDANVICIGEYDRKPYEDKGTGNLDFNNFYCYGDGKDGTYTASELGLSSTYGSDDVNDDTYNWSWTIWKMDPSGIALPSNSNYLQFM